MFHWSKITSQSLLRQRVVKIRPHFEWISKILSSGLWAWKKLFFTLMTFFGFGHCFDPWNLKKWLGSKNSLKSKIFFFHACQPCNPFMLCKSFFPEVFSQNFEELVQICETREAKVERINRQPIFSTISCCLPSLVKRAQHARNRLGRQQLTEEKIGCLSILSALPSLNVPKWL